MCGIFGIVINNDDNIYELIINGLIQLQNRGYDSAGLAVIKENDILVNKYASTNDLDALNKIKQLNLEKNKHIKIGIGHNRWATHGGKTDANAHPHLSNDKNFALVHNGIIENYFELKKFLIEQKYIFYSQTDTEVVVNLIEYYYSISNNTVEAITKTINSIKGTYGLLIVSLHNKDTLYCVRNGSPLLVGQNENNVIITSEQNGFCGLVNNYITLNPDDICVIKKHISEITVKTSHIYIKKTVTSVISELTPYPYVHWTLKEIYEQPNIVLNAINNGGRIKDNASVKLGGLEQHYNYLKNINNIIILGCGTSYFAGLYGMYFFKQLCVFNTVLVFDGADFNDFDIPNIGNTAFILVSQSGETKDLHRCIEIAKQKNIVTIGVINVVDSLIAREVDCGIYCNAGKEVGVASTKAFTSQVICLSMCALWFSELQNVSEKNRIKVISDLHNLSNDIKITFESCSERIIDISKKIKDNNMFLLGKGSDEYVAREGSLKIKEISYIHSEGYSSSSLKHGPFALLDEKFPVIILNLDQKHRAKTINCYQEVLSRNSPIIFITNDYTILNEINESACYSILIPENRSYSSLLGILPLQLLAYNLSINRGINPDKPKNLAKVVTVE